MFSTSSSSLRATRVLIPRNSNKVSLENVALAYGDKGTVSPDVPGPLLLKTGVGRKSGAQPSKAQVAKSSSGKGNNRGADSDGDDGDDEVVDTAKNEKTAKIQDGDDGDDEEESDDDDLTIIKDRPKYIIKRFRRMLSEYRLRNRDSLC